MVVFSGLFWHILIACSSLNFYDKYLPWYYEMSNHQIVQAYHLCSRLNVMFSNAEFHCQMAICILVMMYESSE
jgi:hypothetical protein